MTYIGLYINTYKDIYCLQNKIIFSKALMFVRLYLQFEAKAKNKINSNNTTQS